jgi:hypothetical protein
VVVVAREEEIRKYRNQDEKKRKERKGDSGMDDRYRAID